MYGRVYIGTLRGGPFGVLCGAAAVPIGSRVQANASPTRRNKAAGLPVHTFSGAPYSRGMTEDHSAAAPSLRRQLALLQDLEDGVRRQCHRERAAAAETRRRNAQRFPVRTRADLRAYCRHNFIPAERAKTAMLTRRGASSAPARPEPRLYHNRACC